MSKKGQVTLTTSPSVILAFALLILVAGAMSIAVVSFRDTQLTSRTSLESDTFVSVNASAKSYQSDANLQGCSSVVLYNGTNKDVVTSEFTLVSSTTNCTALLFNNTLNGVTITANYTKANDLLTDGYNASNNGATSLSNLSAQFSTIGTIIGVALLVGIVIGAFALFGSSRGL